MIDAPADSIGEEWCAPISTRDSRSPVRSPPNRGGKVAVIIGIIYWPRVGVLMSGSFTQLPLRLRKIIRVIFRIQSTMIIISLKGKYTRTSKNCSFPNRSITCMCTRERFKFGKTNLLGRRLTWYCLAQNRACRHLSTASSVRGPGR